MHQQHRTVVALSFLLALSSSTPAQDLSSIVPADSQLQDLATGFGFTEGPAVGPQGALFFTDLGAGKIHRRDNDGTTTDFRTSSTDLANGLAFDAQGRLHACEGGSGRLTRTETDGSITVLANSFEEIRFNAPNDLALVNDGSLYFTDPFFGNANSQPQPVTGVYHLAADGTVTLVADHDRPNGTVLSPDQSILYVTNDSPDGQGQILAYDRNGDGSLTNGRLFATAASVMDGMTIDAAGHVYATSFSFSGSTGRGVWIFDSAGTNLGLIATPQNPTNCTLAGNTLYITAGTAVYSIQLNAQGIDPNPTQVEGTGWGRLKAAWGAVLRQP
ncbi:MAG: SMP-30/gluconolactonase/LRE family protein [Candidatus Latescibacteria bacterium]|nr:SMP-30/gluconolactonase/LRE family protein [Candidatus Latescibacterota bacterium]